MKYPAWLFVWLLLISPTGQAEEANSACLNAFKAADFMQAYGRCIDSAEQGDKDAAFIVARLYAQGVEGRPDLINSVKWLQRAVQLGHVEAAYNLGIAYHYGKGIEQDLPKALEAYRLAAAGNNPKALRNLGALYETGSGVSQDLPTAFLHYEKSAWLGLPDSQLKVAVMLLRGMGTEADPALARVWMDKAAASGHAAAQVTLAILLAETDFNSSLYWYQQASKQDNPYALHNLAILYYNGIKLEKDLLMALAYADKSISLGNEKSRRLYDAILREIQHGAGPVAATTGLRDGAWLAAQPAHRYVIQLAQLASKFALQTYVADHGLQDNVNYLYGVTKAGRVYVVLYAVDYSDYAHAQQAAPQLLPASIVEGAWIRSYGSLQQDYSEARAE